MYHLAMPGSCKAQPGTNKLAGMQVQSLMTVFLKLTNVQYLTLLDSSLVCNSLQHGKSHHILPFLYVSFVIMTRWLLRCCTIYILYSYILVAWLYNNLTVLVLIFSVAQWCNLLWRHVVKWACSVWMCSVFIVWNLLEDTAQLQPH